MSTRKRKIDAVTSSASPQNKRLKSSVIRHKYFEDITLQFTSLSANDQPKNIFDLLLRKFWASERHPRTLFGWGCNAFGQLGIGNKDVHDKPERIRLPRDVFIRKVVSGNAFVILLTFDGRLFTCGWCPGPRIYHYTRKLQLIQGLPSIRDVVAGKAHMLAIADNGSVFQWTKGTDDIPKRMPHFNTLQIRQVSCGQSTCFAIEETGHVYAWGVGISPSPSNVYGQLGLGDLSEHPEPTQLQNYYNIKTIEGGDFHTLALTQDGLVLSWGSNMAGQLGIGDQRIQYSVAPTWVEKLSQIPIVSISCGDCSSLALAADGTLYGWGKNADGQLGRIGDDLLFPKPIKMPEKKRVVSVVSGYKHSLALMEDNEVWSWGQARIGQLGRDDVESNKKTWDITELKERTVVSIFAGAYLSFALCN